MDRTVISYKFDDKSMVHKTSQRITQTSNNHSDRLATVHTNKTRMTSLDGNGSLLFYICFKFKMDEHC